MTFDPFDLVRGVPRDVLEAGAVEPPTDYLRTDAWLTRDDQFRAFRSAVGPLALGWWHGILALTKREGVYGVLDIDAHALSVEATGTADYAGEVQQVMAAAVDAELVWMRGSRIRVRRWLAWQVATTRERTRLSRARVDVTRERDTTGAGVTPQRDTVTPERFTETPQRYLKHHEDIDEDRDLPDHSRAPAREASTDFIPVVPKWWNEAAHQLAFIHQDSETVKADLAQRIADHRFSPMRRHDERWTPEAYSRAAFELQRRFDNGWRPKDGTPESAIAYYFSTVASHRVALPALAPPTPPQETHTDERPRHAGLAAFD